MSHEVFVLMPFGDRGEYQGGNDESNFVYDEIIIPGIRSALGEDCAITREVDENKAGLITTSIVMKIARAEVVLVDITGWNPNVFLELGIRYALRNKVTIIVAQEGTNIPFDIAGYRLVFYNRFRPREAQRSIGDFIRRGISDETQSDSIVFDTFRNISVQIPNVVQSYGGAVGPQRKIMSWDDYMGRVGCIAGWLNPLVNEGRYVPDAVLGVSNGGLIAADLIGKAVFSGGKAPILGLWAQRFSKSTDYFDNAYNQALTSAIKESARPPIEILLVDDHFGTGNTALQAIDYLKRRLGPKTRILFVPLVTGRPEHISKLEDHLLFNYKDRDGKQMFALTREEFETAVYTNAHFFPYFEKQISRGFEHIES